MLDLTIELENPRKFLRIYPAMGKRLSNWEPIASPLRRIFVARHRQLYGQAPVGQMNELGPSILRGQVFGVRGDEVEYGSRVEHATFYDKWRRKNLGGPLLVYDAPLDEAVGARVLRWTVNAR